MEKDTLLRFNFSAKSIFVFPIARQDLRLWRVHVLVDRPVAYLLLIQGGNGYDTTSGLSKKLLEIEFPIVLKAAMNEEFPRPQERTVYVDFYRCLVIGELMGPVLFVA